MDHLNSDELRRVEIEISTAINRAKDVVAALSLVVERIKEARIQLELENQS
jgi:hypothetical protein